MKVTGKPPAFLIPVKVILRPCALTDIPEFVVFVKIGKKSEISLAGGLSIDLFVKPAVLHSDNEGIGEHCRA